MLRQPRLNPPPTRSIEALSSPEPDPKVVHAAIEENRYLSGYSVIAAMAKIDSQSARIDVKFSQIDSRSPRFGRDGHPPDPFEAEVKTQGTRIDDLRQVIWPLIVLLAVRHSALQGSH